MSEAGSQDHAAEHTARYLYPWGTTDGAKGQVMPEVVFRCPTSGYTVHAATDKSPRPKRMYVRPLRRVRERALGQLPNRPSGRRPSR